MATTRVRVNMGRTINLGNYESLRLDECIEVDCEDPKEVSATIDKLTAFLDNKLEADAKRIGQRIKDRR